MSKLYFFYGVMGARKSAEAIMTAYNYENKGLRPYCLKPAKDTRGDKLMWESRIEGLGRKVDRLIHESTDLFSLMFKQIVRRCHRYDVIIIDEVQFLQEHHIWELAKIADQFNIPILCYGLKLDFKGDMFPSSYRLMCLTTEIHEIKTMTKEDGVPVKATMCVKAVDGKVVFDGDSVEVGGDELYIPVSRKRWMDMRGIM